MERDELLKQYDRFIDQVREEAKDLYWLYNFFFLINSALLGSVFIGRLQNDYLTLGKIVGMVLSLYWLGIVRKQRMWRNDWVKKIQYIEELLGYEQKFQMWKKKYRNRDFFKDYLFGKHGVWRWLFVLPIGFGIIWISLLLRSL